MSLAAALQAEAAKPARQRRCRVCNLLASLAKDEAAALREALADREQFGHTSIERALESEGFFGIADQMVARHRRECQA